MDFILLFEADGLSSWGAKRGQTSFVITYDLKDPSKKYHASWNADDTTHHLPETFDSFRAAKRALGRIAN